MTTDKTEALIEEARLIWEADDLYPDQMIPRLVKALEESEREQERYRVKGGDLARERDEALLTVERVRAWAAKEQARTPDTSYDNGHRNAANIVLAILAAPSSEETKR